MKFRYFKHDDCGVCKAILPKVENIAKKYDIEIEIIDTKRHPDIAAQKLIFTVPVLIVEHENKELNRWVRNFSIQGLEEETKYYLERI
jgi:thiol-disulfide isomerase/thioredoxin